MLSFVLHYAPIVFARDVLKNPVYLGFAIGAF